MVSRTDVSMKADSVSPARSTLSAASRNSGSTRSEGRVAFFMWSDSCCVAFAAHFTFTWVPGRRPALPFAQPFGPAPNTRPLCSRIAWNWMSGTRSCVTRRSELYWQRKAGAPTTS
jgi:hypothetical protein